MRALVISNLLLVVGAWCARRPALRQSPRRPTLVTLRGGDAPAPKPRAAIVTGGARGIGRGISEALASAGHDLLLTYNTNATAAEAVAAALRAEFGVAIECVGGDVATTDARDAIFAAYDAAFGESHDLGAVVHNAGQYVGITADNADGLAAQQLGFGDGSLLPSDGGAAELATMRYYQKMYGDAFVDLCERGLARMGDAGGSLVGVSSPGCSLQYNPNLGYDMPGAGKCVMEYAMRLFAMRAAPRRINVNVIVPGVTETDAWGRLAATRGADRDEMVQGIAGRICPMGTTMTPRQLGDVVAFLCSPQGRFVTGVSLPADGGVHLKT